eukprot:TRINITY_DN1265_c2_g1_i1.p1 TRINITY_DN1265_c2_g1~~TRINITY_DN1265_c2_g1_i1.p1  ORF type:complete len:523 (-),score=93.28 TRINITY_DN1265_c2_g1_i1:52-1554(-)
MVWAGYKAKKKGIKPLKTSPMVTQTIHGVTMGLGVAVFLEQADVGIPIKYSCFVGSTLGAMESVVAVLFAYALELSEYEVKSGSKWQPPPQAGFLCKAGFSVLIGFGSGRLLSYKYEELADVVTTISLCILIVVYATNMGWRLPPQDERGQRVASGLWPLLSSSRGLCGPFGAFAGTFAGTILHKTLVSGLGNFTGLAFCILFAYMVGLIYAIITDVLVARKPGRYAIGIGTGVSLFFGLLIQWMVGLVLGSIIGCVVGTYLEKKQMQESEKLAMEPIRYTNAYGSSTSVDMSSAGMKEIAEIHGNLPTLCRASTPQKKQEKQEELMDADKPLQLQDQSTKSLEYQSTKSLEYDNPNQEALENFEPGKGAFHSDLAVAPYQTGEFYNEDNQDHYPQDHHLAMVPQDNSPQHQQQAATVNPWTRQKAPKKYSLKQAVQSVRGTKNQQELNAQAGQPRDAWSNFSPDGGSRVASPSFGQRQTGGSSRPGTMSPKSVSRGGKR